MATTCSAATVDPLPPSNPPSPPPPLTLPTQVCWDGGNLLCCDYCPASMHPACIGMTMLDAATVKKW